MTFTLFDPDVIAIYRFVVREDAHSFEEICSAVLSVESLRKHHSQRFIDRKETAHLPAIS
jgi:hypothetical protein